MFEIACRSNSVLMNVSSRVVAGGGLLPGCLLVTSDKLCTCSLE